MASAMIREPWFVAAWPGMGHVGVTAAYYLMAKLRMHQIAEFSARDLFELDAVDVSSGIIRAATLPRSRLFLSQDPLRRRDVIVFLGEAQPATGKLALCQRLIGSASGFGASRVFTFAAMATEMEPRSDSRVFGVATGRTELGELRRRRVAVLDSGRIGGLNGVLLAAASEAGLPGVGLLGEIPMLAPELPYPKASASVLRVFGRLAGLDLDLEELDAYGAAMEGQVADLYERLRGMTGMAPGEGGAELALHEPPPQEPPVPAPEESPLDEDETERIEKMFSAARRDRSKAFDLKKELDRLRVFARYEDRFLDLFEKRHK